MPFKTFDDFRRETDEKGRLRELEKERQRQAEEERLRTAQRQQQERESLENRRKKLVEERWGTPELAYRTWEERARKIIDIVNAYGTEKRREAENARCNYGGQQCRVYIEKSVNKGLFSSKWVTERRYVGSVRVRDFCWIPSPYGSTTNRSFYISLDGKNDCYLDGELTLGGQRVRVEDVQSLKYWVRAVVVPDIVATLIEQGRHPMFEVVDRFFEFGPLLKSTPRYYRFSCTYPDDRYSYVDISTALSFEMMTVEVPNPDFADGVRKRLQDNVDLDIAILAPPPSFTPQCQA